MPIKLNGSTSGYVQIDATAIAGTTQITLPAITGGSFIVSDSSGNVGIGTSSPGQRLDLGGGSLTLYNSTGTQQVYLYRASATNYSSIGTDSSAGGITFTTGTSSPAERMRVDSSGNLQVGGTTVANTVGYVNSRTNTRAWARWAGSTGTIASSYNVSSVTRNSTGDYTVNYTTALADANYAILTSSAGDTVYGGYGVYVQLKSAPTTTTCAITTRNNSGTYADSPSVQIAVFGN